MRQFRQFFAVIKSLPVFGALAIVLLLNFAFHLYDPFKRLNPDSVPAPHGWAWWAVKEYRQMTPAPDVVLLGSSQMMSPVWWQEADFRQNNVELVIDHRSKCLENLLRQRVQCSNLRCFNFALPGGMMSDICMVTKAMFHGERGNPRLAVIGLSPREFMDNSFHCPAGTKHYQYLSRFCDTTDVEPIGTPELPTRIQCWLQKIIFFKFKSKDIQLATESAILAPLKSIYDALPQSRLDKLTDADQSTVIYKDELQRGFWVAKPNNPDRYLDMPSDCIRRLAKPNKRMFENQKEWLKICLDTCRREGVSVVLVNMPLSAQTRSLIAPGVAQRNLAMLRQLSQDYNVLLVDADQQLQLSKSDFTDWSHMDAGGGYKLLSLVAAKVSDSPAILSKLVAKDSDIASHSFSHLE